MLNTTDTIKNGLGVISCIEYLLLLLCKDCLSATCVRAWVWVWVGVCGCVCVGGRVLEREREGAERVPDYFAWISTRYNYIYSKYVCVCVCVCVCVMSHSQLMMTTGQYTPAWLSRLPKFRFLSNIYFHLLFIHWSINILSLQIISQHAKKLKNNNNKIPQK